MADSDSNSTGSETEIFSIEALPVPGKDAKDEERLDFVENQLLRMYAAKQTILGGLRLLGNADTQQMRGGAHSTKIFLKAKSLWYQVLSESVSHVLAFCSHLW